MNGAVLGGDISLTSSGVVAMSKDGDLIGAWTLPLDRKAKGDDRLMHLRGDLLAIFELLRLGGYPIAAVALEDLPKNAQGAGLTGRAQGVVREVLASKGILPITLAPASLKLAWAGGGRASKDDMRDAVVEATKSSLKNSDEVDAYALAHVAAFCVGWEHCLATTENIKALKLVD